MPPTQILARLVSKIAACFAEIAFTSWVMHNIVFAPRFPRSPIYIFSHKKGHLTHLSQQPNSVPFTAGGSSQKTHCCPIPAAGASPLCQGSTFKCWSSYIKLFNWRNFSKNHLRHSSKDTLKSPNLIWIKNYNMPYNLGWEEMMVTINLSWTDAQSVTHLLFSVL